MQNSNHRHSQHIASIFIQHTGPRCGFSSKVRRNDFLSPRSSLRNVITLTKSKSYDKSENGSIQNDLDITNEEIIDESNLDNDGIPTDSDLDIEEFDVLKKLPTWKKLKLSVYERRQRYRRRQKNIQRLRQQQVYMLNRDCLGCYSSIYMNMHRPQKRKRERNNRNWKKRHKRNDRKRKRRKVKLWRKVSKMMITILWRNQSLSHKRKLSHLHILT